MTKKSKQGMPGYERPLLTLALPWGRPEARVGFTQVVHIRGMEGGAYRIWPTTYIECAATGVRRKLIAVYNVGIYPHWQKFTEPGWYSLVFEALPQECISFHLIEEIHEPGGECIRNCPRFEDNILWVERRKS